MKVRREDWRRLVAVLCLCLGALVIREHYILVARVDNPMVGDVRQYVAYAYNLVEHGTFSSSVPGSATITADSYRGPGYPLLIAAAMLATGASSADWYFLLLHAQAFLGAATVALAILLGWRHRPSTGLLAGLLLAVWPMHVTFTGVLLSEVLFGFLLAIGTWTSLRAADGRRAMGLAAGIAWGWSFLVNPVVFFVPLGFAAWLALRGTRRAAVNLLAAFALLVVPWTIRQATVTEPHVPGRSVINLVQGSWPLYHDAWVEFRRGDKYAQTIMRDIDSEVELLDSNPSEGARKMLHRISEQPVAYARWYMWDKPFLLWDWDIRIGAGELYLVDTVNSPYQSHGPWAWYAQWLRKANPAIFLLALAGCVLALARRSREPVPLVPIAYVFAYLTVAHMVFQAEPRYSVPYRFIEFLLAASTLTQWLPRRHSAASSPASS